MVLKIALIYLAVISLVAIIITCHDKRRARQGGRRVPELTLLNIAVFGGSVAMYLTMLKIRHKTKHPRFMVGIPFIIILQIAAVASLIYLLR